MPGAQAVVLRPADDESDAARSGRTPAGAGSPGAHTDGRFLWLVAAAALVGLAVRVAIGLTDDAPSTDETAYLRSGLSLVAGDGFERGGRPELHFPPFVPFVLGAAARVFSDPHTGAVVMTCLAGTALIVPLALLGRSVGGEAGGVTTAWMAALAPGLATMPATRGAGSEAQYALLVVTATWLVVSAADQRGRGHLARLAAGGFSVGLAYLSRPEGLFVAVPLLAAVLALARRRSDARLPRRRASASAVAAFVVPLVLCVVPYASYLHDHTGQWQVTAKTRDVSLDAWHAVARGDREARDQVLYTPDPSGLRFPTERSSLPSLARADPAGYLTIVGSNLGSLGKNVVGWWLLPLPVWCLAIAGAWRHRRSGTVRLLAAVALLPVATALAFFVQPRYLIVTVALAAVLAGGVVPTLTDRWRAPAVAGVLVVLAVSTATTFAGRGGWWHPGDHTDQRAAGEWVAARTAPADRVMTRSFVVEYYAERPAVAVPYADLDEIVAFARHYGVRYLVADASSVRRMRPQLAPLLERDVVAGLRLEHEECAEGACTRVFALDPAPPPSDEAPPTLGFVGDNG